MIDRHLAGIPLNQHSRLAATLGGLIVQSEHCLKLFCSTGKQQFDFSVTFLSIHRDEKCCHLPGGLAAHPYINPRSVT